MMTRTWPWMALILTLVSFQASALEINEQLNNIRMLAIYPKNVVVLNRGLEDGVTIGTHAKLRSSEGYAARAVCVRAGMITSHWRLYRIVESQLISKDLSYTLIGMNSSEAPRTVEAWQATDHETLVPDFDEKKLLPPEKAPVGEIKPDLPEALDKDEAVLDSKKSAARLIIEKNYDPERLRKDFQVVKGSIYASPWSVQKGGRTDVENVRYGAKIANEGTKYIFGAGIDRTVMRAKESGTDEKVVNEGTEARATFTVKELTPSWDAYSDLTYRQARFGEFSTPKSHYLFAPIGFTRHFGEGVKLKKSFLSYAPTYDKRVHEGKNDQGENVELEESGLRHAFRLYLFFQLTPDFSLSSDTRWRPIQQFSTWSIDMSDNLSTEVLTASWKMTKNLYMDYEFQWLDDAQLRRLSKIPRVVTMNSLNIRYDFNFL